MLELAERHREFQRAAQHADTTVTGRGSMPLLVLPVSEFAVFIRGIEARQKLVSEIFFEVSNTFAILVLGIRGVVGPLRTAHPFVEEVTQGFIDPATGRCGTVQCRRADAAPEPWPKRNTGGWRELERPIRHVDNFEPQGDGRDHFSYSSQERKHCLPVPYEGLWAQLSAS